uniref:AB hydrolase-1 domain-containing protein n=1 Tax=Streptomyces sp. WT6 TaxID=1486372 RepID=A0A023PXQ0_9ACTN|nr:hypothetical protein wt6.23 [Streptomyces sp. WT6]
MFTARWLAERFAQRRRKGHSDRAVSILVALVGPAVDPGSGYGLHQVAERWINRLSIGLGRLRGRVGTQGWPVVHDSWRRFWVHGKTRHRGGPRHEMGGAVFVKFATRTVHTDEASVFVRYGGEGPPLLLLHGHPRTSATWHRVAPLLIRRGFTVVCPDLRGYGRSRGPAPAPDHAPHSKRAGAKDMVEVMRALGHQGFGLVGHDRGAAVALRLVLDHPTVVTRVAFLDGLPLSEHLRRADARFATAYWHWFFFAQPETPERVINADPDAWYRGTPESMGRRTTTSGGPPLGIRTSSAPCWRTTAPGSPWTASMKRLTEPEVYGSIARSWSCGHCGTIWRTCTATRG